MFFSLTIVSAVLKDCDTVVCLLAPTSVWIVINGGLVFVGSYLVTYHAVNIFFRITNTHTLRVIVNEYITCQGFVSFVS